MKTFLSILLVFLTVVSQAGTVTGDLSLITGSSVTTTFRIQPLTVPQATSSGIVYGTTTTYTATNGVFSITLVQGNYRFTVGQSQFNISVPSGTGTNTIQSIISAGNIFTLVPGMISSTTNDVYPGQLNLKLRAAASSGVTITTNNPGGVDEYLSLSVDTSSVPGSLGGFLTNVTIYGQTNPLATASRVAVFGPAKELTNGAATTTEIGYVSGVTSAIQDQFTTGAENMLSASNTVAVNANANLLSASNVLAVADAANLVTVAGNLTTTSNSLLTQILTASNNVSYTANANLLSSSNSVKTELQANIVTTSNALTAEITVASNALRGKLMITADDTTPGFGSSKIVPGNGLVFTTNNPGANETLTITATNTTTASTIGVNSSQLSTNGEVISIKAAAWVTNLNLYGSATNIDVTAARVAIFGASKELTNSPVSTLELNYLYGSKIFNPADPVYGAIPDDGIDDTPAFQAMTAAIGAAGRGRVVIPGGGVYNVDAWRPTNNMSIEGGGFPILRAATNGTGTVISGSTLEVLQNFSMTGVWIQGSKSNSASAGSGVGVVSGSAVRLAGTNVWVFRNIIQDAANAGFNGGYAAGAGLSQRSGPYHVFENVFINCGLTNLRWGMSAVSDGVGIYFRDNVYICTDGGAEYAIDIEPDRTNSIVENIHITGNTIIGSRLNVVCNERVNGQVENVFIKDNLVDSRGAYDPSLNNTAPINIVNVRGLVLQGNQTWPLHIDAEGSVTRALYLGKVSKAIISGNIFNSGALTNSSDERVISFDSQVINYWVQHVTNGVSFYTNSIDAQTASDISFGILTAYTNTLSSTNVTIADNYLVNTNTSSHRFGIFAAGTAVTDLKVRNNLMIGDFDTLYYVGDGAFVPVYDDGTIGTLTVTNRASIGDYGISGSGLVVGTNGTSITITSGMTSDGGIEAVQNVNNTAIPLTLYNKSTNTGAGNSIQWALNNTSGSGIRGVMIAGEKDNTFLPGAENARGILRAAVAGTITDILTWRGGGAYINGGLMVTGITNFGLVTIRSQGTNGSAIGVNGLGDDRQFNVFTNGNVAIGPLYESPDTLTLAPSGTTEPTISMRYAASQKWSVRLKSDDTLLFSNATSKVEFTPTGHRFYGAGTLSNANVSFYDSSGLKTASITDQGGLDLSTNLIGSTRAILIDRTSTPTFETRVNGVQGVLLSMGTAGLIIDATNSGAAFTVRGGSPLRSLVSAGTTYFNLTTNVSAPLMRVDGSGGSAASPGYGFYGNLLDGHGGMGMYKIGPGTLGLSSGNALAITVSSNQAVTFAGRHIHPTVATQTLAAGSPIVISAKNHKVAGSGGAVTLASTPTIAAGSDGEEVRIIGTSDTNTLTIQDQGTLAGSLIQLSGGATSVVLGKGDVLSLVYISADGFWYSTGFNDN